MSHHDMQSYYLHQELKRKVMMRRRRRFFIFLTSLIAVLLIAFGTTVLVLGANSKGHNVALKHDKNKPTTTLPASSTTTNNVGTWRIAWGVAMAWGYGVAQNTTVREIVTSPIPGTQARIRISNQWGNADMNIGALTIAQDLGGANINPASIIQATFNGQPTATIPPGGTLLSDPITINITAGETLAISLWVTNRDLVTLHPTGITNVSYFTANNAGNQTTAPNWHAFPYASAWPRWVDALEVLEPPGVGGSSIVIVGDSITDGYHATQNWASVLQARINQLPISQRVAVINEAITANTLTALPDSDADKGGGQPGLQRLGVDALSFPGVGTVIVFLGTNDLYFGATAEQLESGLEQAAAAIHQAGLKAIVVTLTPRMNGQYYWTPAQQERLEEVNQWILNNNGVFDGVINFAPVISDTYNGNCQPTAIFPAYNSGDNLHPNAAGQIAMANSVSPSLIGFQQLPVLNQPINPTPTPGCLGVNGIESAYQFFKS